MTLLHSLCRVSAVAFACLLLTAFPASAQSWVHPGIVVSPQQLAATRAAYQNNNTTVVSEVDKAMASSYGSTSYTVKGYWPGGISQ